MDVITSPNVMQSRALEMKKQGKRIGLVPTMGFLHDGHLSLMRLIRPLCDTLVVSIFVNPSQFGPTEDLEAYPRDFGRDAERCAEADVDLIFHPDATDLYAADASIWIDEEQLSLDLCGAARPGHFRGVCTVVAKLFNLVQPDTAVFGEKDAQQLRVIERMVRDLNFPVEIIRGPIVREPDGLAMSSRNKYLSSTQRRDALCLKDALDLVRRMVGAGERSVPVLRKAMLDLIAAVPHSDVDYIAFVDDRSLERVDVVEGSILVALAVKIGPTRLIDNIVLDV